MRRKEMRTERSVYACCQKGPLSISEQVFRSVATAYATGIRIEIVVQRL